MHNKLIIAILCGLVLGIELYLKRFQILLAFDGYSYVCYIPQSVFPPGYPLFIWIAKQLIADRELAARVVSIAFHVGTIPVLWLLAKRFMKEDAALFVAGVYGICPLALRLGIDVLSESTYVFFIVLFFLWFVDRRYLLAGVAIGMAYVTRPEAVVVVIGVVIAEIINWLRCRGRHGYRMAVNRKR